MTADPARRGNGPRHRLGHRRWSGAWLWPGLVLLVGVASCGHGAPQYSGEAPSPVQVYGQCAFCHDEIATAMTAFGGHGSLRVKCERCHVDLEPGTTGCGHRDVPRCPDCHREPITHHDPAVAAPQQCTLCHTPHGSANLLLVRSDLPLTDMANMTMPCSDDDQCAADQLCASDAATCGTPARTGGCAAAIVFTNLRGRADGSFASASRPGTGVCEVCHTATRYYRSDGGGEPHFTTACYPCHPHARSFLPR